jgi:hypothetical protein
MRLAVGGTMIETKEAAMRTLGVVAAIGAAALAALGGSAGATAPPIGKLPPSPVTTIITHTQELIAIPLPRGESGLVWRAAPPYDARVARPYAEQDMAGNVTVLVYLTRRPGTATLNFGLTNDDHPKVYRAARYRIVVKPRSS